MSEDDITPEDTPSESDRIAGDSGQHAGREASVNPPRSAAGTPHPSRSQIQWRTVRLWLGALGLSMLLGAEAIYIAKSNSKRNATNQPTAVTPSASAVSIQPSLANRDAGFEDSSGGVAAVDSEGHSALPFGEEGYEEEPAPARPEKPKHFNTVHETANGSCTTASVDGLSRQIIAQVRCTNPKAFVPLPSRPNLVLDDHIYAYLEASAREHLLRVLDTNRNRKMTVHSVLRTLPQQYLVWRWAASRRCGVQLATPPGSSNHEIGRALDIADHAQWRSALEAEDFHWLGASDIVHFDFKTSRQLGAAPDVAAFQSLWNRNHSDDRIGETGRYDANTELRLKKSPPGGFPVGPTCSSRRTKH